MPDCVIILFNKKLKCRNSAWKTVSIRMERKSRVLLIKYTEFLHPAIRFRLSLLNQLIINIKALALAVWSIQVFVVMPQRKDISSEAAAADISLGGVIKPLLNNLKSLSYSGENYSQVWDSLGVEIPSLCTAQRKNKSSCTTGVYRPHLTCQSSGNYI